MALNFFPPKFVGLTSAGILAAGYKLYVYAAGTTTPSTVYSDADDTSATNPYTLDARGECEVWLNPSSAYKFELKVSASGSSVWTVDDISIGDTKEEGSFAVSATGPFAAESVTVRYYRYGKIVALQFPIMIKAGNNTAAAITLDMSNIPSSIRPAINMTFPASIVRDNGSDQATPGVLYLPTSGNASIFLNAGDSTFTNSTSDTGWSAFTVTYLTA